MGKMTRMSLAEAAEVLGVEVDAPIEDVRKAYKNMARLHHPDK